MRSFNKFSGTSFQFKVELVDAHNEDCGITVQQIRILRYFLILKKHLQNPQNKLNSNIGFYLNHTISATNRDHPLFAVFDHFFYIS